MQQNDYSFASIWQLFNVATSGLRTLTLASTTSGYVETRLCLHVTSSPAYMGPNDDDN